MRFFHRDHHGEERGHGRHGPHPFMHAMRRGMGGFDGDQFEQRRGGRKRVFDSGELRLVLLKLISEQPRHGYDLIRAIETLSGGAYAPSPGVVYPTMTLLIDMDLAEEQSQEGPRKLLTITEAGRQHLEEHADEVATAMARLAALAKMSERTDAAPIRRAMHNLKTALHTRLTEDGTSRETQLEIARILDEAASKIERL
ncbi:PadR family transcriptional regulator [Allorhizobium sp. BGMRC 0089]|uniref:PadR family transcriptional regulator n=1 Tax=Allorhizobium sonneratiae TaxID=2934936 RepID=UPI002033A5AF|nr:PadR family transcriptional regulator [Allorhizobium sonneratiae]MCM2291957.1 PadR family transcriptional regulator [Allorhizobium sonneratiae]